MAKSSPINWEGPRVYRCKGCGLTCLGALTEAAHGEPCHALPQAWFAGFDPKAKKTYCACSVECAKKIDDGAWI
jgi:hypothetical protein